MLSMDTRWREAGMKGLRDRLCAAGHAAAAEVLCQAGCKQMNLCSAASCCMLIDLAPSLC